MSQHLSSEQISWWIAGEHSDGEEQHVRECADCRIEVERWTKVLGRFRAFGQQVDDRCTRTPSMSLKTSTWPRLALSAVLTLSLVAVALWIPQSPDSAMEEPFLAIPFVAPLAPYERATVMRMRMPVAALIAAGFEVDEPESGSSVTADVIVGQDGRAHAVRLLSKWKGNVSQ